VGVAVIVGVVVAAGGMRSITFVQAFQYWLKLTAVAAPVVFVLLLQPAAAPDAAVAFEQAFPPFSVADPDTVYRAVSLLVALLLGTLGLPHVLVRFYTNPDGVAARRTTLIVLGLLSVFYLFPVAIGMLGRVFQPELAAGDPDALLLLLPHAVLPSPWAEALTALVIAGAFGAFLSTSSGLVVSLAGVVSQELFAGSVRGFRIAAALSVIVPLLVAAVTESAGLAGSVGLVFAFTASTLCPALLLGIWWRGLTARGTVAGMATGAVACGSAILLGWLVPDAGLAGTLIDQPAAWTVPLATLTMVLVSRLDRRGAPRGTDRVQARHHVPRR
jgi:Na+(H+)/acetate symporter ActP